MKRPDSTIEATRQITSSDQLRNETSDEVLQAIEQHAIAFSFAPSEEREQELDGAIRRARTLLARREDGLDPADWRSALDRLVRRAVAVGAARVGGVDRHSLVRDREQRLSEAESDLEALVAPWFRNCQDV